MKKRHLTELVAEHPEVLAGGARDPMSIITDLRLELGISLAQIVAELVDEEQEAILGGLDTDVLKYDWNFWGRPTQIPPADNSWDLFAFVGGRGTGKSRAGAEWVHSVALRFPGCRIALVARTAADARDVMVEGDSGLENVGQPDQRPRFVGTRRKVVWPNGSQALLFSAEEPDQLRGPQFHFAWADEAAAWKHSVDDSGLNAWDNLTIATRLGDNPQIFATTTPKRTPFMFDLLAKEKEDERVLVRRGTTMDNAGNLSKVYLERMHALYAGTRLADQELYGLMLEEVDGALWDDELIRRSRIIGRAPACPLKVIAVDPSVAENPRDECGILVVGSTNQRRITDRHAYVLEDASMMGSPAEWAKKVVKTWEKHQCPVVVETNQGGAMAATIIHGINADIPVLEVRAYHGKALRAEPVTLKYDQEKVHHVGVFAELESQMVSWIPGETKKSPDRVDALVYALTALIVKPPSKLGGGRMRIRSAAGRRVPESRILGT